MLKIDNNQCIKMSRGDDVKFPLFVNKGTSSSPIRYVFVPDCGCEVYFYIFDYKNLQDHPWNKVDVNGYNPNLSSSSEPILVKVFKDSGVIETELYGETISIIENAPNINSNGDMMIWLRNEDTATIPQGSYIYQIKVKIIDYDFEPVIDENTGLTTYHYIYNTVTNKLPIYIIDDNYGNRVWE